MKPRSPFLLCVALASALRCGAAEVQVTNGLLRLSVDSSSCAWRVADVRSGVQWRQAGPQPAGGTAGDAATAPQARVEGRRIVLLLPHLFGQGSEGTVSFELDAQEPELVVTLDGDDRSGWMGAGSGREANTRRPFVLTSDAAAWIVPQQEGMLYPVRGDPHPPRHFDGMLSMPWIGLTDTESGVGMMLIGETPDDLRFRRQTVTMDGEQLLAGAPEWLPQKGGLGYPRRLRYAFFDRGGYVAMCRRYREYVRATGTVRTLEEKARENPSVRLLAGAVDVWYTQGDPIGMAKLLQGLGVDRCLLNISSVGSRPAPEKVAKIHGIGYLAGHYDIYTDLHEAGHHWDTWPRYAQFSFPESVIRRHDGSLQPGWYTVNDGGKPYKSFVVCALLGRQAMEQRVPADHGASGHSVWFVDCATSCGLYECYHSEHPVTRTEDREAKLAQLAYLTGRGLVTGSEGGRDWSLRHASYFEGLMSTACWQGAPSNMSRLSGPLAVDDRYTDYDHGPARRLPLWELVHHDASCVTWWWGDAQLRVPGNWWLKDLWQILYGTMPLWMLRGEGEQLLLASPDAFRDSFRRVSPVTRAVFGVEMVDHVRLTPDAMVQRVRWANGLTVTANFGGMPQADIPPYSYRLEGDPRRFPALPLGVAVTMPQAWEPPRFEGLMNPDFALGTFGWWGAGGMAVSVTTDAHSGSPALRVDGRNEVDWNVGGSRSTFRLAPGGEYRFGARLRIEALDPADRPPWLALQVTGENGWITNVHTPRYDTGRMGEWQRLEAAFVCPEAGDTGRFAIEKFGKEPVTMTLLMAKPFFRVAGSE